MKKKKYFDHDWVQFMVDKPEKAPKGAHFGVVLFGTRREVDPYTGNSYYDVPEVTYFAFPDRETLGEWALRATKDNKQFFCFKVDKLGDLAIKVNIDVGV